MKPRFRESTVFLKVWGRFDLNQVEDSVTIVAHRSPNFNGVYFLPHREVMNNPALLEKLPAFFRTVRGSEVGGREDEKLTKSDRPVLL